MIKILKLLMFFNLNYLKNLECRDFEKKIQLIKF